MVDGIKKGIERKWKLKPNYFKDYGKKTDFEIPFQEIKEERLEKLDEE